MPTDDDDAETQLRRPYRPRLFTARRQLRILELGFRPGKLARKILGHRDVATL